MSAEKVVELYSFLQNRGIDMIIDGGWAIDALTGKQNRPHDDLDIAITHDLVPALRSALSELGFKDFYREDTKDYNFVLTDENDNRIDVHSYLFDSDGNNIYGIAYQLKDLKGRGSVNGTELKCITPQSLLNFHTGYEVDEQDYFDVKILCNTFGFEIPDDYDKFMIKNAE